MQDHAASIAHVMRTLRKQPWARPALTNIAERSRDTFKVLISCIISLRTKDAVTAAASGRLYALAETPEQMMRLKAAQIARAIYPAGFYRTKAKRIKEIAKRIVEEHGGRVPEDFETLLSFKGVGRKTANIVMVYGFGREGLPIDVHCHRVPNRLGWVQTKTPEQTEEELRKILPKQYWMDFNNLFVQFGQNVCRPVRPKCGECPVSTHCAYYRETYRSKQAA